jgi:hypothetical protein
LFRWLGRLTGGGVVDSSTYIDRLLLCNNLC